MKMKIFKWKPITTAAALALMCMAFLLPVNCLEIKATAQQSGNGWTLTGEGVLTIENDDGMKDWTLNSDYELENVKKIKLTDGVSYIAEHAFNGCLNLTSVEIPKSVNKIETYAFAVCAELTEINIPEGVTNIGESAFMDCVRLSKVTIPDSVNSIGSSAFSSCSKLTEINIPKNVTRIEEAVFYDCTSLVKITIPESVVSIGTGAFQKTNLTEIIIPKSVSGIENGAFDFCSNLKTVTFNGTAPQIGSDVFGSNIKDMTFNVPAENKEDYAKLLTGLGASEAAVVENTPKQDNNNNSGAAGSGSTQPESGGSSKPEMGGNVVIGPETGGSTKPEAEDNKTPETGGSTKPEAGDNKTPETGGSTKPEAGDNKTPETGGSTKPEAGDNKTPETGGSTKPEAGDNKTPETGGSAKPEAGDNKTPETGGSTKPEAGGNISVGGNPAPTISNTVNTDGAEASGAAAVPVIQYKTSSSVAGSTSTVNGVYILNKGVNAAILTALETITEGYNLAAEEKPFAKITDMDGKKSHQAKKCLDDTAAAYGAVTVGYINIEVGKMTRGRYLSLDTDGPVISIKLSIPGSGVAEDVSHAVIRVREGGKVDILKDMDTDLKTVTIETTAQAGAYAIIRY